MSTDPISVLVPGRGMVNPAAERINKRLEEYDERLRFGFNEVQGDWIAYVRMPRDFDAAYYIDGNPVYPVVGFGSELPSEDTVMNKIWQIDSQRHPHIREAMNKANERVRAEADEAMQALTEEAAERIEFEMRNAGETKFSKVYMSGGKRARKRDA